MEIDITNVKGSELAELMKKYSSKDIRISVLGNKIVMTVRE